MSLFHANLPAITISSGSQNSGSIDGFSDATSVLVVAPATLTGTLTVQGSLDNSVFFDVQSGNADITLSASDAAEIVNPSFQWVRVRSSTAEGADRTISLAKQFLVR